MDFICAETKDVSDVLEQVTGRAFTKHGSHCSSPKVSESQDAPDYVSSARSHPHGAPDPWPLSEKPSNLPCLPLSWTLFIPSRSHDDIITSQKPLVPSLSRINLISLHQKSILKVYLSIPAPGLARPPEDGLEVSLMWGGLGILVLPLY